MKGDLALAMRADFALDVIREVARQYLDRVDLRLGAIDVVRQGSLERDTFLGRIRAGDWTVSLSIHEMNGVLRAGRPDVGFLDGNRVALAFPVHLERGQGRLSHFPSISSGARGARASTSTGIHTASRTWSAATSR